MSYPKFLLFEHGYEVYYMATSSILKDFYIRNNSGYERLKVELNNKTEIELSSEPLSLKKSKDKLVTFIFR